MKTNTNDAGSSLESTIAKNDLLELISDLSDQTLEKLFDADDAISIFSYLTKGIKATLAIRDAFFMEKNLNFYAP